MADHDCRGYTPLLPACAVTGHADLCLPACAVWYPECSLQPGTLPDGCCLSGAVMPCQPRLDSRGTLHLKILSEVECLLACLLFGV